MRNGRPLSLGVASVDPEQRRIRRVMSSGNLRKMSSHRDLTRSRNTSSVGSESSGRFSTQSDASSGSNYRPARRTPEKVVSPKQSFVNQIIMSTYVVMVITGAGMFFLPATAASIGYVGLAVALPFLASISLYCSHIVFNLKQELCPNQSLSIVDFAREITKGKLRTFLYITLEFSILTTPILTCSVYLSFVPQVLHRIYCGIPQYVYSIIVAFLILGFLIMMVTLQVTMGWKAQLLLSWCSLFGVLASFTAALLTLIFGGIEFQIGVVEENPIWDGHNLPDCYGTIGFLFAVAMYLFPLHSGAAEPEKFYIPLAVGYGLAFLLNLAFALLCLAIFGASSLIKTSIVINSLTDGAGPQVIRVLLCCAVFVTFLVILAPASAAMHKRLSYAVPIFHIPWDPSRGGRGKKLMNIFKMSFTPVCSCLACLVMAIFIPEVNGLLNICAAVGLTFTGQVAPLILYMSAKGNFKTIPNGIMFLFNIALTIFCCLAGGYTFYKACVDISDYYKNHPVGDIFVNNCTANCTTVYHNYTTVDGLTNFSVWSNCSS